MKLDTTDGAAQQAIQEFACFLHGTLKRAEQFGVADEQLKKAALEAINAVENSTPEAPQLADIRQHCGV